MNQASQSLGQMPAGNNGESSCRFQFNPGDWYQKERQHNVHGLQHNDFIDVFEHCSFHDYWLDRVQKPICLMHFIGRTEPALLETGGGGSIPPIFGGFLISVCMPSGDRMNTIDLHVTGNIKQNGTCAQRYFYFLEIISEAWELLWQRKDCLCSCGATVWWGRGYRYMQQSSVTYIPDALSTFPVSPEPY